MLVVHTTNLGFFLASTSNETTVNRKTGINRRSVVYIPPPPPSSSTKGDTCTPWQQWVILHVYNFNWMINVHEFLKHAVCSGQESGDAATGMTTTIDDDDVCHSSCYSIAICLFVILTIIFVTLYNYSYSLTTAVHHWMIPVLLAVLNMKHSRH